MKKTVAWICVAAICLFFIPVCRAENPPSVSAQAAAVINGYTCGLLYAKNSDARLPMASTTKIMTALILCEEADPTMTVAVTPQMVAVEGSSMGLLAGDSVTYHDLLYGLLLASGNDAANTIAISMYGSVDKFAARMNERAGELGLTNTHFVTPSGLDADGHYTSAFDLARLAAFALENKDFAAACSSYTATLCYGNPPYSRSLKNHNKLLVSYDGLIGVKTGFTKTSGRCLVTAARRDGKLVVAVTLHDPDDWQDHTALLDYGLSKLVTGTPKNPAEGFRLKVVGGTMEAVGVEAVMPEIALTSDEWKRLTCEVSLPAFIYAPDGKGQRAGHIKYSIDGDELFTAELVLADNIEAVGDTRTFGQRMLGNLLILVGKI